MKMIRCAMLMVTLFLFLLGCGSREIERKAFVIGVGLDVPSSKANENNLIRYGTYQVAIPRALKPEVTNDKAYQNLIGKGYDVSQQISQISQFSNKELYFAHNQIILISDHLAKQPESLERLLDFFVRHEDIRRSVRVFITKGKTEKYLNVKNNDKLPSLYIDTLASNLQNNSRTASIKRLGDLQEDLLSHRSFVLPVLAYKNKDEIKLGGAAIIKGSMSKLTHELNDKETETLNILKGEFQKGMLLIKIKDDLYTYKVSKSKRKMKLIRSENDQMTFKIVVRLEGEVQEVNKVMDNQTASEERIEEEIENRITRDVERLIEKLQKEYKTDILGLGVYLEKHHNKEWHQVKKDWESGNHHFSKVKIETQIVPTIYTSGGLR